MTTPAVKTRTTTTGCSFSTSGSPNQPANAVAASNQIIYRAHVSFSGPNPLNLPNHIIDPLTTPVNAGGVRSGPLRVSANNDSTRIDSQLVTMQSAWLGERFVATFGFRRDEQEDYGSTTVLSPTRGELGATRIATPNESSGLPDEAERRRLTAKLVEIGEGLVASAEFASGPLGEARNFNNDSGRPYDGDWRKVNHLWRPQRASGEANAVPEPQRALCSKQSPRFNEESNGVRKRAFAAWIVSLCPDAAVVARHRAAIREAILHYHYERLHLSQFFALENAWWRLPA